MIAERLCYAFSFLAEALIVWLYLDYLFRAKRPPIIIAISFFIGYTVLYIISLFENTTVNAAFACTINFCLIQLNYVSNWKTVILHTAFLCFLMVGSEVLPAVFIGLFGYGFSAYKDNFHVLVMLAIFSKLFYLMSTTVGSRIFTPHKQTSEEPRRMTLFCLLPFLSACVAISIVYFGMNAGMTEAVGIMSTIMVITLLVVNLIVLVLYNYLQKANEEYLALQLSIQKEQADTAYYIALQEQFENQRILAHDLKKHLGTISGLARQNSDTAVEDYVTALDATLAPSNQAKLCTDPILNLLLLRIRDKCKSHNVTFHCDVRENISDFMEASSITTLYGNLLSNALEAASISEEKVIEMSVTRNIPQSVIVISILNSCDRAPESDGHGGFQTRKEEHLFHGVGLRSIARVVKKYGGVSKMYYDPIQKQFHHIIQLPCPSKQESEID